MHGYCEQMSIPYRDHARHYDHWNEFEKNLVIGEIAIASQSIPEHDISPNPFSDWLEFAGFNDSAVSMLGMIDKSHLAINFNFKTDNTDIERVEQLLAIISRPISLALRADMLEPQVVQHARCFRMRNISINRCSFSNRTPNSWMPTGLLRNCSIPMKPFTNHTGKLASLTRTEITCWFQWSMTRSTLAKQITYVLTMDVVASH